jgi:beta-lactamase superfamily II metal-dependent hydrolase
MHRILIALALFVLLGGTSLSAQTLRIYQIDVEQADSALIVMPNGKTLLIDSGKNGHGPRIAAVMQRAGVAQIDAFVASHYHEDHFGGIDDLVDAGIPVLEAFDRGDKDCCLPAAKRNQATFRDYQRTVGEDAITLRAGDVISLDPTVEVRVISSGGVVVDEANPTTAAYENDMSVSLLIAFAGFTAFYGGDIEEPTEAKIAARDLVMDADVYKANHHGSHSSSSPEFTADLQPSVVLISNGNDAVYKHPRQASLDAFAGLAPAAAVFQTNKCFRPSPCANVGDAQIADPESSDRDGTILISVDASTSRYSLTYGDTTRTFAVKHPVAPAPATPSVVITDLLPNPAGDDERFERVTIANRGPLAVSLAGWQLRDRGGASWDLGGSLAAGESRTFLRDGQAMSLNNAGDEIVLLDPEMIERDRFEYAATGEGTLVRTPHWGGED